MMEYYCQDCDEYVTGPCPNCVSRDVEIAQLKQRVSDLQSQLRAANQRWLDALRAVILR